MTDWTGGYMADLGYTFGYYQELDPSRVKLTFLNSGLVAPEIGTACELGFGQGMSVNMHAAASVTNWYGTDFNPAQAGFAQELAAASESGARLYDESFADFASREDLPDFDYIGLHGIWSWISDEYRVVIVDFIRRKLKVGGVLYVSYNTQPGWSAFAPVRHLMAEHAEVFGANGTGIVSRIDGALDFTERLLKINPGYARANPQIGERLKSVKSQDRHYLAHEYFNRHWEPMHFAKTARWLAPAKVGFACSAYCLDHIDVLNITSEQQEFLREIPDPIFRESVRDFVVNQQFRRDFWVKGARKLDPLAQVEACRQLKVMLITNRADVSLKVNGSLGMATMDEAIYNPILEVLADHQARTLAQLEQSLKGSGVTVAQLLQVVMVLTGGGHLASVQEDAVTEKAKRSTEKLNAYLMKRSRGSSEINCLSSPVSGGGIAVGRFQQLFLLALKQGNKRPTEWAVFAWQILSMQGQKIVKEGRTLETAEENMAELSAQAEKFSEIQLPVLKALQIA